MSIIINKKITFSRIVAGFTLALFMGQTSFPLLGRAEAEALTWSDVEVSAPLKEDNVVLDDDQLTEIAEIKTKANVLFMVEATAGMQFTPTTAMPSVILATDKTRAQSGYPYITYSWRDSGREGAEWRATKQRYNLTAQKVIDMMRGATFGIGALPVSWSGQNLARGRNLYGRERDGGNNFYRTGGGIAADMAANRANYYFPFASAASDDARIAALKEGYAKQTNALEIAYTGASNAAFTGPTYYDLSNSDVGASQSAAYKYGSAGNKLSSASAFPYALIYKNPDWWESGPGGATVTDDDLVPNDSRMYQLKLVLWNLLENRDTWAGLRFGLASTFLPHTNDYLHTQTAHTGLINRFDFSGMYKVPPFGSNVWTSATFSGDTQANWGTSGGTADKKKYVNGVLTQAISGHVRGYNSIHAQFYPMWQHQTIEPLYSSIQGTGEATLRSIYKVLHRGSLLVPIKEYDELWSYSGKPTMKHVDRVRMWIDGFADLANGKTSALGSAAALTDAERSKQWSYYRNPELGVAGIFVMPGAIFPDPRPAYGMTRDDYKNNIYTNTFGGETLGTATAVWYSNKDNNTNYDFTAFPSSSELENSEATAKSRFNKGSGEASGTALDFFSPPASKYSALIPEQYPIRSTCENNWVIVFSTGQEVGTEDDSSYEYTTAQAIKNLYDATNKATKGEPRSGNDNPMRGDRIYAKYERVSMLVRNNDGTPKGAPAEADLDNPIQTLVVGIIPDYTSIPDPIEQAEVRHMQLNLTRMAVAGRGGNPDLVTLGNMQDAEYQPFLANNTDLLTIAIMDALKTINDSSVIQPGKGVVAQARAVDGLGGSSDLYTYKYRVLRSNQWEAEVTRYAATSRDISGQWNLIMEKKWEMGDNINGPARQLAFWHPTRDNDWTYSGLTPLSETETDSLALFRKWTKIDSDTITPPPAGNFDIMPPHKAMVKWLKGYDYSYVTIPENTFPRSRLLTDFGNGGMVVAQNPVRNVDYLPGYKDWATNEWSKATPQPNVLYGHTNDGILHMVNISSGSETRAILPPPSLLPGRLASLTTFKVDNGKRQWNLILGNEASGGKRSNAVYTLDGALQKRDYDLNQTGTAAGWGSYLIGALGKGGAGLYMVDVTDHDKPAFKWYKERVGNALVRTKELTRGKADEAEALAASSLEGDPDRDFMKLGFNSPKPGLGVARLPDNPAETDPDKKLRFQNFIVVAGGAQLRKNLNQNGSDGAAMLLLDPHDGLVIVDDNQPASYTGDSVESAWRFGQPGVGPNPYMGMMTTEPTLIHSANAHPLAPYIVGRILAGDNQGNIFSLDMETSDGEPQSPSNWKLRTLATLRSDAEIDQNQPKSYATPLGLAAGAKHGYQWISGGTSDVKVRKDVADDYEDGWIRNEGQLIFAFRMDGNKPGPYTRNNLKELGAASGDVTVFNPNSPDPLGDGSFDGWYMPLRHAEIDSYREYVSAKPVIVNGTLFVATFTRTSKIAPTDSSVCALGRAITGNSKLYAVDVSTGGGNTWLGNAKAIEFIGAKIVGLNSLVESGLGKLLISFDILDGNSDINDVLSSQPALNNVLDENGDPISDMATLDTPLGGGTFNMDPNSSIINYWLKK
ncbi:MAG: hypothetical protein LBT23_12475 [Synergistaceae bacterium]|nr:hypothetical protein [Synergistaceae bacterium]